MKRSMINKEIKWARALLKQHGIWLPMFGYYDADDWEKCLGKEQSIAETMLGWDISDFGTGDYYKYGSVLFTIRNGCLDKPGIGTPYAEKLILLHDGQCLPLHFHYTKTEDIINRGGGILALKLYNANQDESVDHESEVKVYTDGMLRTFKAGETVEVTKGNSITLTRGMYHIFWAKEGEGDLIVGEVSSINDDTTDNHFDSAPSRFSEIEEDEPVISPLCNEYDKFI